MRLGWILVLVPACLAPEPTETSLPFATPPEADEPSEQEPVADHDAPVDEESDASPNADDASGEETEAAADDSLDAGDPEPDEGAEEPATAPSAPTVTAPLPGATVTSALAIAGATTPDAVVGIALMADEAVLGEASVGADSLGNFSYPLVYSAIARGQPIRLQITAATAAGTSPVTEVSLVQGGQPGEPVVYWWSPSWYSGLLTAPTILWGSSPVEIAGWVEPDAWVHANVWERRWGTKSKLRAWASVKAPPLNGAEETKDVDGVELVPFTLSVSYPPTPHGTLMALDLFSENDFGFSAVQTENFTSVAAAHVSGQLQLDAAGAAADQAAVMVKFYPDYDGITALLYAPMFERSFPSASSTYSFDVHPGTYRVIAFLDLDGDRLPNLGTEAQHPLTRLVLDSNASATLNLTLAQPDVTYLSEFSAQFVSEPVYPPNHDAKNPGVCGGSYIRLQARLFGAGAAPDTYCSGPNGVNQLLNDGGCGDGANNTWSSYDTDSQDDLYTKGLVTLSTLEFYVLYEATPEGFVHVETAVLAP